MKNLVSKLPMVKPAAEKDPNWFEKLPRKVQEKLRRANARIASYDPVPPGSRFHQNEIVGLYGRQHVTAKVIGVDGPDKFVIHLGLGYIATVKWTNLYRLESNRS